MMYWSNSNVPAIEKETGTDTQVRLLSKQLMNNTAYTVSTTSYALLTHLLQNYPVSDINRIQKFLQQLRDTPGGMSGCLVRNQCSLLCAPSRAI